MSEPKKTIVQASIAANVEDEKCVVAQYRTSLEQKSIFTDHVAKHKKEKIPIEWVIDIADESNGWFYGTAYNFDDTTNMLHVMVPDKENPTFDGQVLLDHRTVHLIECVDGKSEALFNKIVRDSVTKVKWDVEWFEESEDGEPNGDGANGTWIRSLARYYIRIANQLLVEDKELDNASRGFVIISADFNLKLLKCSKGRGIEDFARLVNENAVQASAEAVETARNAALSPSSSPSHAEQGSHAKFSSSDRKAQSHHKEQHITTSSLNDTMTSPSTGKGAPLSAAKLADMSTGLRECVVDILDDRDRLKTETQEMADLFHKFVLSGDLDFGVKLMDHFEGVRNKAERQKQAQVDGDGEDDVEEDKIEAIADDAIYLAQKLERNLTKIARQGGEVQSITADDEVESLRRSLRDAKLDIQDREDEIRKLRSKQ